MNQRRRALGIIPARGGSVGVPRKNLREVAGMPLVAHAVRAALSSALLSRTIVNTDSDEIAQVARKYGAEIPFMRPPELGLSTTKMFDVLIHAVETLESESEEEYEDVVILQPTSPFRRANDIDNCLRVLWSTSADSVITVYRHPQVHPRLMYTLGPDGTASPIWEGEDRMPQRQDLAPVFIRTGLVYAFKRRLLQLGGDIYGRRTVAVEIPYDRSFNIDDPVDLTICRAFADRDHLPESDVHRPQAEEVGSEQPAAD